MLWQAFQVCINLFYPKINTIVISILPKLRLETLGNIPEVSHLFKTLFWIQRSTIWSLTQVLIAQSSRRERQRSKELQFCVISTEMKASSECCQTQRHLTQQIGVGVHQRSFLVEISQNVVVYLYITLKKWWQHQKAVEHSKLQNRACFGVRALPSLGK